MTNPTPRKYDKVSLLALSRAARFIAAFRAEDGDGARAALHEAKREGNLLEFAIAAGILCAQMADQLHGDRAQLHLDALALDADWFRERELALLQGSDDAAD